MTCDEAEILLHALIDGELDACHAREVEAHIATCPRCAAELAAYRQMREAMTKADLRYTAPASLRQRIDAALPKPAPAASQRHAACEPPLGAARLCDGLGGVGAGRHRPRRRRAAQ